MPTPRRRPPTPPARRPKVAGLRKPRPTDDPDTGRPDPAAEPVGEPVEQDVPDQDVIERDVPDQDVSGRDVVEREVAAPAEPLPEVGGVIRAPRPTPAPRPARPADPADEPVDTPDQPLGGGAGDPADEPEDAADLTPTGDIRDQSAADARPSRRARRAAAEDAAEDPEGGEAEDEPVTRPSGKRRSTGSRVPAGDTEDSRVAVESRPMNLAIVLAVVALVLGGLAVWFKGEADSLADGTDATNVAFTDAAATSEAKGQLTSAVERTLSFNFADLDASAAAVRDQLTGRAACEYNALFGKHKDEVTAQKQVVTTKVRAMGINRLEGDQAYVLVFVDQTSTRTDKNETSGSRAQFGLRGERVDGRWKIASFDMLGQPLPGGSTLPDCR